MAKEQTIFLLQGPWCSMVLYINAKGMASACSWIIPGTLDEDFDRYFFDGQKT